jgi:chromosome segregation ATPase
VLRFKEAKVRLESDLRAGREEVLNLQNINQTLQEEVARAQQQIKSLEVENQELLDNFEAVSLANTRLEAINSGLTEDLNVQQQLNQQSHEEKAALENRLRESEAAVSDLHDEIKQLNVQSRETQLQLRKSQAIRVSHENALGSIRVRLGASKMAKRGVQIQLNQAEKDLATLKVQNVRLETTLSNALSEVVGGRSFISEQKQRIVDLQERHERFSQRLLDSEETVQRLQAEVRQLEQESQDFKHEINRLKTIVDQAETEIASLKSEITSLHAQRVMNREELATQRSQIAELQRAKTDLEKSLAERVRLVETQQGNISRLEEEAATDKATIARLDSEKSNIMRLTNSLKAEVDARDATILDQQRQIEKLEQDLRDARRSAQDLRVRIHDQESQNESLRLQNEAYAIEVPSLREQLQDLKASKAALGAQVQGHTEERVQAETEGKENERVSAQASSPTLVMSELEPPPEEREEDFGPGILDRPMSPHKRINTGHNGMKAFRVLGAEAAASQPSIEEDEMKKELWDLCASQHKLGSLPENENAEQPPEENKPAPRMRRKLTKKKKVEQLNTHETGSLHNLIRYGSFSKPHFERPLRSSRSVSAKH